MSGSPVESPPLAVVLAVVTDFVLATKREAQRTFGTRICVLNAKLLNRRPIGIAPFPRQRRHNDWLRMFEPGSKKSKLPSSLRESSGLRIAK